MAPERRRTSPFFIPGRSRVRYQPLGVAGIIVPWNYPLYLAMSPLVGAIAAGNRVMLKLSEFTPRTAELLQSALAKHFPELEVCAVLGPASVGQAFSRLPFDHLLFTGSTATGRHVMKAAAENLTPVTLELGGKSPAIVAEGYPVAHAAQRIVLGKAFNAGQTCIAPDYVLVPRGALDAFLAEAVSAAQRFYPDPLGGPDYSSIASDRHYQRVAALLEEARTAGARIVPLHPGQQPDARTRRFPLTAIVGAARDSGVLTDEIFGPLLPIVTYDHIDEVVEDIARRPAPLALYIFDRDRRRIEHVLAGTKAGGVTINDVIFHIGQEDLPFGGVGPSGIGRYHGRDGFITFSNARSVFHQSRLAPATLLRPPFEGWRDRLIRLVTSRRG
jgi:acyl-CoA reductase-like NAD-dependent aldehyde dehydrogenase